MKKNNIISDWLDQYGNPQIDKFVETQLNQNKMNNNGIKIPNAVGGYKLGNTTLGLTYKPKWIHRKMMSIFFGLKWVDELNKSE